MENNINLDNISMNNITLDTLLNCGFTCRENQKILDNLFRNNLEILTNEINNKFASPGEKILINQTKVTSYDFTTQRIISILSTSYFEELDNILKDSLFDKCIILYEKMWCKYVFLSYMITNFNELLKLDLSKSYPTYNQETLELLEHFSVTLKRFLDTKKVKEQLINLVEKCTLHPHNKIKHYIYNNIDYKAFNKGFSQLLEKYIKKHTYFPIYKRILEQKQEYKKYEVFKDYILQSCYNNYIFICKYYMLNYNIQNYINQTFNNADNIIFSVFLQDTDL